ncbi:MAG: zinc dependent phospholipase C family protein [Clostridia bacterium]|nr:zinc dependent phospholipase C family protein [Clostridia bacterium]
MSSFKMHLVISKKVQEKFDFGNEFLLGALLPDLYKLLYKDRSKTHFEKVDMQEALPNIEFYCEEYLKTKSEIKYGYLSHLIEDKIWFHEYIFGKYVIKKDDGKHIYKKDFSEHTYEEYLDAMYTDYSIIDEYIKEVEKIDVYRIADELKECAERMQIIDWKGIVDIIDEVLVKDYKKENINSERTFISIEDYNEYIQKSTDEAIKVISEYM